MNTHTQDMGIRIRATRSRRRALACVMAAGLLAVACAGITTLSVELDLSGFAIKFGHDSSGYPTFTVPRLPDGDCVKVEVRDQGGHLISVITCPGGSTHPIPPGAHTGDWETGECPEEFSEEPAQGTSALLPARGDSRSPIVAERVVDLRGGPFAIDDVDGGRYKNALYHFRVTVPRGQDAFSIIEPILLGGPGTPVPNNVEVISFTQVIPDPQGVRLIVADTDAFDVFRLDWNGHVGYADLAFDLNTNHYQVNGWDVVESLILGSDIHTVGNPNEGFTTRKTVADSTTHAVDARLTLN